MTGHLVGMLEYPDPQAAAKDSTRETYCTGGSTAKNTEAQAKPEKSLAQS